MLLMTLKNKLILGFLLLLSQHCLTQSTAGVTGGSGYQYGRADANAPNLPSTPTTTGLRPIIPVAQTSFGTAPTGFSSGFGQSQRPVVPTAPVNTAAVGFTPTSPAVGLQTGGYSGANVGRGGLTNRPITTPQTYRAGQRNDGLTGTGTGTGGTGFDTNYDDDGDFSAIPGVPGVNYPVYSQVPRTSFDCRQQPLPGYYSDVEAQCQVFHICALNRTYSFLCPNGTLFSQESLVCVWWNQFDCGLAPALYPNNAFIYDYGNDRSSTNAGFVAGSQQSNTRQQSNFPLTSSSTRTTNSNIYGTATNIRPTAGPTFPSVSPVQQTGYSPATTAAGGRFAPASSLRNNNAQIFPIGSTSTLPFGAVITPAGNDKISGSANTPFSGIQETAFTNTNAAVAQSATNREYLPPSRP